jgi:hypothetical protein
MGSSGWEIVAGLVLVVSVEWSLARGWWLLLACCGSGLLVVGWLVVDPGVVQPDKQHPD